MPFGMGMPSIGGAGAGAAAGAAGGIFGVPWSIALPIIISLLGSTGIFGGGDDEKGLEEAQRMKQQMGILGMKPPYQSPYLPIMDQTALTAILNQLKRGSNWGWPEGQQQDTGWIEDLIARFTPGAGGGGIGMPGRKIRLG